MRWSYPVSLKKTIGNIIDIISIWHRFSFTQVKNVMKYTFGAAPVLVINEDIVFLIVHTF